MASAEGEREEGKSLDYFRGYERGYEKAQEREGATPDEPQELWNCPDHGIHMLAAPCCSAANPIAPVPIEGGQPAVGNDEFLRTEVRKVMMRLADCGRNGLRTGRCALDGHDAIEEAERLRCALADAEGEALSPVLYDELREAGCTCGIADSPNELPPRDPACPVHGNVR